MRAVAGQRERQINELLTAWNALKCFASSARQIKIEIFSGNATAVSYIINGGRTVSLSLNDLAVALLSWCEERRIDMVAIFLPWAQNSSADREPRAPPAAGDWQLCKAVFDQLASMWELNLNLFATRWNA